mmetsp:Transcript_25802/g.12193  ORF Transcript_25802/g.12193 Transcript_25802/m.12193 type:complete len:102 (+) Transcript_25802:699-1004(+)
MTKLRHILSLPNSLEKELRDSFASVCSIESHGEHLKQGWLNKRSRYLKKWRQRWVVLSLEYLLTYKRKGICMDKPTEVIKMDQVASVAYSNIRVHSFIVHA